MAATPAQLARAALGALAGVDDAPSAAATHAAAILAVRRTRDAAVLKAAVPRIAASMALCGSSRAVQEEGAALLADVSGDEGSTAPVLLPHVPVLAAAVEAHPDSTRLHFCFALVLANLSVEDGTIVPHLAATRLRQVVVLLAHGCTSASSTELFMYFIGRAAGTGMDADAGGLASTVTAAMAVHVGNAAVQRAGLTALEDLPLRAADAHVVLAAIAAAAAAHPMDAAAIEHSLRALVAMCTALGHQRALALHAAAVTDAVAAISPALAAHVANATIQALALQVATCLVDDLAEHVHAVMTGSTAARDVAAAMRLVACSDPAACGGGGVSARVRARATAVALRMFPHDADVQAAGKACLDHLAGAPG
jgi:hypothetical protein